MRLEDGGRSFMQARCVQLARMGCIVFASIGSYQHCLEERHGYIGIERVYLFSIEEQISNDDSSGFLAIILGIIIVGVIIYFRRKRNTQRVSNVT